MTDDASADRGPDQTDSSPDRADADRASGGEHVEPDAQPAEPPADEHRQVPYGGPTSGPRIVVVDEADGAEQAPEEDVEDVVSLVGQPAKVMRIGTMIKQLLDEVRSAPLDDAARARLAAIHERSLHELEEGLSPELIEELHRITLPFVDDSTPSDAELRIAQAQLVGWLEGLFHGIQTALVAQQVAAQAQLTQMRRALPPGAAPGTAAQGFAMPGGPDADNQTATGTGQYL